MLFHVVVKLAFEGIFFSTPFTNELVVTVSVFVMMQCTGCVELIDIALSHGCLHVQVVCVSYPG